jgi:uncharacterized membrane protein YczE
MKTKEKKLLCRVVIYLLGVLVMAVGLTMNTKTGLGVSPILSVSYCVSQISGWSLGNTTFLQYCLFVVAEFVLRGKNCRWYDLLQLPFSLVFSRLLDLSSALITYDAATHGLGMNLLFLLGAIVITGVGITMTVNMQLVPNPGDGIVQAIAERIGKDQGFAKNWFDVGCVAVTCVLSLALTGSIIGIGIGTLIAMIGVGRAVAAVNHFFKEPMCRAAGLKD